MGYKSSSVRRPESSVADRVTSRRKPKSLSRVSPRRSSRIAELKNDVGAPDNLGPQTHSLADSKVKASVDKQSTRLRESSKTTLTPADSPVETGKSTGIHQMLLRKGFQGKSNQGIRNIRLKLRRKRRVLRVNLHRL